MYLTDIQQYPFSQCYAARLPYPLISRYYREIIARLTQDRRTIIAVVIGQYPPKNGKNAAKICIYQNKAVPLQPISKVANVRRG